jgi:hypothetical protein
VLLVEIAELMATLIHDLSGANRLVSSAIWKRAILCEKLGSKAHLGSKPAFILTKAQSVKFCPGEVAAGARKRANFLDAAARNSSQRSAMKPQR